MVYCGWLRKPEFQRIVFMPDEFSVVLFELFLNFSFTVRLKNLKLVKRIQLVFRKLIWFKQKIFDGTSPADYKSICSLKSSS